MFTTRKEVDQHVIRMMSKLQPGPDRDIKGFVVGRMYSKVYEYAKAIEYMTAYLKIKEEPAVHKHIAFCYKNLKTPDYRKALEHYQRSIEMDPKQPEIVKDVTQMLVDQQSLRTKERVEYWAEISKRFEDIKENDILAVMRCKASNEPMPEIENMMDSILEKELTARPHDYELRIRYARNHLEKKQYQEAFRFVHETEMANPGEGALQDWYEIILLVLQKREYTHKDCINDWSYWQLLFIAYDRLLLLSLLSDSSTSLSNALGQLFKLDQYLYRFSQLKDSLRVKGFVSEYHQICQEHYTGQLLLHAVTVLFKRELLGNKLKWSSTVRNSLPLLLLGYQLNPLNDKDTHWQRHCNAEQRALLTHWKQQIAFRCAQLGRTLHGCLQQVDDQPEFVDLFPNSDDLLSAARKHCADGQWRSQLYQLLYTNAEHKLKEKTSQMFMEKSLQQPLYEMPTIADIEQHELTAQANESLALDQHVYLTLGRDLLAESMPRLDFLQKMQSNALRENLTQCTLETLSEVDVEVFLYAVSLQAQRKWHVINQDHGKRHVGNRNATARPTMLPYANVMAQRDLIMAEQIQWWQIVQHQVFKKLTVQLDFKRNDQRDKLQRGLEAIRGIKGPNAEIIIVLQLAKILSKRSDRSNLELRIEMLYKEGIGMFRRDQQQQLEPFFRYFKYANAEDESVWVMTRQLIEDAINYLSARYFRRNEYIKFVDEMRGLQLPLAIYMQAEAFRLLAEANRTSLSGRQSFQERRLQCLKQIVELDLDNPLTLVGQRELRAMQAEMAAAVGSPENHNNSSAYEDAEDDYYAAAAQALNRSRRQLAPTPTKSNVPSNPELEQTVKQLCKQMCGLKDDLGSMRAELMALITDKFTGLEELLKKCKISGTDSSDSHEARDVDAAAAAAALGLDEYLNMEDANFLNGVQTSAAAAAAALAQERFYPNTPVANGAGPNAPFNPNVMFNQNQMYNYYTSQFLRNPPTAANMPPNFFGARGPPNFGMPPPHMYANPAATPFMDSLNYGISATPPAAPSLVMPQAAQAAPPPTLNPTMPQTNLSVTPNAAGGFFNGSPFVTPPTMPAAPQQQPQLAPSVPQQLPATMQTPLAPYKTTPATPAAVVLPTAPTAAPAPTVFNRALNNQPVEKEPPANVVITSSDPLPKPAVATVQPTLSVTIPAQHIKPSLVQSTEPPPMTAVAPAAGAGGDFNFNFGQKTDAFKGLATSSFSFKTQVAQAAAEKQKELELEAAAAAVANASGASDQHNQSLEADYGDVDGNYDPRPDFKGIIPLPDEVEVRTGEEDEEIVFEHRAKLFRLKEKEWKERGIGQIKILKNKSTNVLRVLMRREQTHKICANHKITGEMHLTTPEQDKDKKSFIWVANDFADEQLQLEKFLVRFKESLTAEKFQIAFEDAVKKSKVESKSKSVSFGKAVTSTPAPAATPPVAAISQPPVAAWRTTTDTPFGSLATKFGSATTTATTTSTTQAASPFAKFSFGQTTSQSSSSGNLSFGNVSAVSSSNAFTTANSSNAFNLKMDNKNDLAPGAEAAADAEVVEEYVPTAQFEPVIPLPELVDVVTGEENELVLFEHRAKLLRFDRQANEWKERGLGNMKLLQMKSDPSQVRLLMRRELIFKLCCNQRLLPDTKFSYAKNSQTSLTWAGQDFAEEELNVELLCVRFKTAEKCKEFYDAILAAQAQMKGSKPKGEVKEPKQDLKAEEPTKGFGDAFKPKAGSWSCESCYTNNDAAKLYCIACEQPKDHTVPPKPATIDQSEGVLNLSSTSTPKFSFGFPAAATTTTSSLSTTSFSFGAAKPKAAEQPIFGAVSTTKSEPLLKSDQAGFGDAFKPKAGSWSCPDCYTSNEGSQLYCLACQAPKDASVPKKDNNTLGVSGGVTFPPTTNKFSFGFAAPAAAPVASATTTTSSPSPFAAAITSTETKPSAATFGSASFNFKPPGGAQVLATSSNISLTSNTFNFSMPKQQQPLLQPKSPGGATDEDDGHNVEEESTAYFAPVIPLPDKIDVKTGEEDEELLYIQRAKLYRHTDEGEWKERGLGNVKILRHKDNKNLRVVMRREQVLKICLNHVLNESVIYKPKDEKAWMFAVHDFSEGESVLERFALRFKNVEIAQAFHNAVTKALDGTAEPIDEHAIQLQDNNKTPSKSTIEEASDEIKALAKQLSLNCEFLTSETKCSGCIGCDSDKFNYGPTATPTESAKALPMMQPALKLPVAASKAAEVVPSAGRTLLKSSALSTSTSSGSTLGGFGGFGNSVSANSTAATLTTPAKSENSTPAQGSAGFLFGSNPEKPVLGQTTLFGGNEISKPQQSIFGGAAAGGEKQGSIFGGTAKPQELTFGNKDDSSKSIFSGSIFGGNNFANNSTSGGFMFGSGNNSTSIFGSESKDAKPLTFGDLSKPKEPIKEDKENVSILPKVGSTFSIGDNTKTAAPSFADLASKAGDDFASLAAKNAGSAIGFQKSETGGFFGLKNQDAFKNFKSPSNSNTSETATVTTKEDQNESDAAANDADYDPHYEPIIALPNEIVVSTGEENETKLFGERAKLFRFDAVTKEWKERGVGEIKFLKHNTLNSYRLLMRREQIHKLVLNMKVGADFSMDYMNEQMKSFIWAGMNYAESESGDVEGLACRFNKQEIAAEFYKVIQASIKHAKDLEASGGGGEADSFVENGINTKAH